MSYYLDNLKDFEAEIGGHHADNGSPTEDGNHGVALHIFKNIGIHHNFCLDVGAFSTKASNIVPIMLKYKAKGLLLDGENKYDDPNITKVWITKENICPILKHFNCPKKFDYMSIDIDNMDFWILKEIVESGYKSNLLVLEFNPIWNYTESYTKKYVKKASKSDQDTSRSSNYGASLRCFMNLLNNHNYRLIHVTSKNIFGDISCNNAFFIQAEFDYENKFVDQERVIQNLLPEPFVESNKIPNNIEKFETDNIEKIKTILKRDYFVEVKPPRVVCITPLDHLPSVYNRLQQICDVSYHPNLSKSELREILLSGKFDTIFTNPNKQPFKLDEDLLSNTGIRLINTASTGINHINLNDCQKLGINVLSLTRDYDLIRKLPSTAELAFGLALSMMRKIPQSFNDVKEGNWNYEPFVGRQLAGMTAGIIGYGRLGTYMAKYCSAFGMKVLVNDPYKNVFDYDQVDKMQIYEESDLISLHVHVKEDTVDMINENAIRHMLKKPYIVNTSRGEIVNEQDVARAIIQKEISGYGTDVLCNEFSETVHNNELIKLSKLGYNVIITPHIGGMSIEGQEKAFLHAVEKFTKVF